jgi:hypothetical protein
MSCMRSGMRHARRQCHSRRTCHAHKQQRYKSEERSLVACHCPRRYQRPVTPQRPSQEQQNVCAIMNPPESETMGRTVTFQDGSTGMRARRCRQRGRTRCVRPYSLPAAGVHATSLTACRRSRVDGSMRGRLSVALLEIQRGASRAESGGVAHDPSTHDTRPGLRAGMAVAVNTATWPAVAVEVLGHSFTPSPRQRFQAGGPGKPSGRRAARGRGAAS